MHRNSNVASFKLVRTHSLFPTSLLLPGNARVVVAGVKALDRVVLRVSIVVFVAASVEASKGEENAESDGRGDEDAQKYHTDTKAATTGLRF